MDKNVISNGMIKEDVVKVTFIHAVNYHTSD